MMLASRFRSEQRTIQAAASVVSAGLLVVMLIYSLGPPPPTAGVTAGDKLWHIGSYLCLTFSLLIAMAERRADEPGQLRRWVLLVAGAVALFGGSMELVQGAHLFGRRTPDLLDEGANLLGVLLGLASWWALRGRMRARPADSQATTR